MAFDTSTLPELPFHCISNDEFINLVCNYDLSNSDYDLSSILASRNEGLDLEDDPNFNYSVHASSLENRSKYVTIDEMAQLKFLPNSLTILQINCKSLKKNLGDLKFFLSNLPEPPSVISLSETWLKPSHQLSYFALQGYSFVSAPRKQKRGGGAGLYVSNHLKFIVRDNMPLLQVDLCDCCAVEIINDQSPNIIVISLYRPPDADLVLFEAKLVKSLAEIIKLAGKKKIVLAADWNINFLLTNSNPKIDQFVTNMESLFLIPTITVPTRITERTATLLDNIFINCPQYDYLTRVIYFDISDHLPVLININCQIP